MGGAGETFYFYSRNIQYPYRHKHPFECPRARRRYVLRGVRYPAGAQISTIMVLFVKSANQSHRSQQVQTSRYRLHVPESHFTPSAIFGESKLLSRQPQSAHALAMWRSLVRCS
eukprot:5651151-Prymnesium_polylepis.1